jgi:hypothetical protein
MELSDGVWWNLFSAKIISCYMAISLLLIVWLFGDSDVSVGEYSIMIILCAFFFFWAWNNAEKEVGILVTFAIKYLFPKNYVEAKLKHPELP